MNAADIVSAGRKRVAASTSQNNQAERAVLCGTKQKASAVTAEEGRSIGYRQESDHWRRARGTANGLTTANGGRDQPP